MTSVYLDHNATSPLRPVALRAMLPLLRGPLANPSSVHGPGQHARAALDRARGEIARLLCAQPDEIVFTSGGTESNNLAIHGVARTRPGAIARTTIEHPSVLEPCARLARDGRRVLDIDVDDRGVVRPASLEAALAERPALVSVQWANHEVGTVQDVANVALLAHARGALVHTDAVQACGRIAVDASASDVDLASLSAHKFGGPPGIGVLYVRRGTPIEPLIEGGGQESGLRAGTAAVALAVGCAAALKESLDHLERVAARHERLRRRLLRGLRERFPSAVPNGDPRTTLANTVNVSFPGCNREALLIRLDLQGIHVSAGAACASGAVEPSPVLRAMHLSDERVECAVRVSFGARSTSADVGALLDALSHSIPLAMRS